MRRRFRYSSTHALRVTSRSRDFSHQGVNINSSLGPLQNNINASGKLYDEDVACKSMPVIALACQFKEGSSLIDIGHIE